MNLCERVKSQLQNAMRMIRLPGLHRPGKANSTPLSANNVLAV
jgi:hypothetical protein